MSRRLKKIVKPVKQKQHEEPISISKFLDPLDDCEEDWPPSIEDQDLWGTKIVHPPRIPEGCHTPSANPLENTDGAEMAIPESIGDAGEEKGQRQIKNALKVLLPELRKEMKTNGVKFTRKQLLENLAPEAAVKGVKDSLLMESKEALRFKLM